MNTHDRLESELASLRPYGPSPALEQRIGAALELEPAVRFGRKRRLALIGGALAAGLLAFYLARAAWPERPAAMTPSESFEAALPRTFDEQRPTNWVYRRTILKSSQAFDDLLASESRRGHKSGHDEQLPRVWLRSPEQMNSILGEL
jgi:hypothetical protein